MAVDQISVFTGIEGRLPQIFLASHQSDSLGVAEARQIINAAESLYLGEEDVARLNSWLGQQYQAFTPDARTLLANGLWNKRSVWDYTSNAVNGLSAAAKLNSMLSGSVPPYSFVTTMEFVLNTQFGGNIQAMAEKYVNTMWGPDASSKPQFYMTAVRKVAAEISGYITGELPDNFGEVAALAQVFNLDQDALTYKWLSDSFRESHNTFFYNPSIQLTNEGRRLEFMVYGAAKKLSMLKEFVGKPVNEKTLASFAELCIKAGFDEDTVYRVLAEYAVSVKGLLEEGLTTQSILDSVNQDLGQDKRISNVTHLHRIISAFYEMRGDYGAAASWENQGAAQVAVAAIRNDGSAALNVQISFLERALRLYDLAILRQTQESGSSYMRDHWIIMRSAIGQKLAELRDYLPSESQPHTIGRLRFRGFTSSVLPTGQLYGNTAGNVIPLPVGSGEPVSDEVLEQIGIGVGSVVGSESSVEVLLRK